VSTTYTRRFIIVCPAAAVDAANAYCKANADPDGGEHTFTVPLVTPPDMTTVTNYWCSSVCTQEFYDSIVPVVFSMSGTLFDAATTTPEQVLAGMGLATVPITVP
jgi:hypothetical protein